MRNMLTILLFAIIAHRGVSFQGTQSNKSTDMTRVTIIHLVELTLNRSGEKASDYAKEHLKNRDNTYQSFLLLCKKLDNGPPIVLGGEISSTKDGRFSGAFRFQAYGTFATHILPFIVHRKEERIQELARSRSLTAKISLMIWMSMNKESISPESMARAISLLTKDRGKTVKKWIVDLNLIKAKKE